MTPVRTAGSPDAEEVSRASTFTLKLKTLARARTLQAFATAADWGQDIENHMSSMSQGYSVKGSCIKLLECFYSAISNGLKQMHSKWPQDEHNLQQRYDLNFLATLRTVNILCTELALCRSANWYRTEYAVQEPGIAVKAGFLQILAPVISKLLVALQPLQKTADSAEQQFGLSQYNLAQLGVVLVQSWAFILQSWPGCKLTDEPLASTIQPVASLALVAWNVSVNRISSHTSSSTAAQDQLSSNDNGTRSSMWVLCCHNIIIISRHIVHAAYVGSRLRSNSNGTSYTSNGDSSSSNSNTSAVAAWSVLASANVQRLVLLGLAAAAAAFQNMQLTAGSSDPDPMQHHKVPQSQKHESCGYMQLLAELGVHTPSEVLEMIQSDLESNYSVYVKCIGYHISALTANSKHQEHQPSGITADSRPVGSSTTEVLEYIFVEVQSNTSTQYVLQQLAYPVLQTLKEVVLLLPDTDIKNLVYLLSYLSYIAQCFCRLPEPRAQQQQHVLQWLLQPLYTKVCSAVESLCQQQAHDTGAATSEAQEGALLLEVWAAATTKVLIGVAGHAAAEHAAAQDVCPILPDYVINVLQQQPVTSLTALGTVFRIGGSSRNYLMINKQIRHSLPGLYVRLIGFLFNSDRPHEVVALIAHPRVQQQLFSLICSQLKILMTVMSTKAAEQPDSLSFEQLQACDCLQQEVQLIVHMLRLHSLARRGFNISTGQEAADEARQELLLWSSSNWVALLGRVVYAFAASMLQQLTIPLDHRVTVFAAMASALSLARRGAALVLDEEMCGEVIAAAAEVTQQLDMLEQLIACTKSAINDRTMSDATWLEKLQQLQQCGAVLCAELPEKFCCNNPACVNLAKLSEQQLVAGKGSRCSGCKVARYCSSDCQLKHWKQHKTTCRRIQQSEAEGKSSSAC